MTSVSSQSLIDKKFDEFRQRWVINKKVNQIRKRIEDRAADRRFWWQRRATPRDVPELTESQRQWLHSRLAQLGQVATVKDDEGHDEGHEGHDEGHDEGELNEGKLNFNEMCLVPWTGPMDISEL